MTGANIIAEVVISFMCLVAAFGIVGIVWLFVTEARDRWRRHKNRPGTVRKATRR